MPKLLFVCNPYAGKSAIKQNLSELLDIFIKNDYRVEIHLTQSAGDATRVISQRAAEFDRIVCGGGDGTLNETVNGLMLLPPERRPALGYIPAGTQNDYARNLGIPADYARAAEIACGDFTRRIDVGQANSGFFNYVYGFGAFTEVSYETPQDMKKLLGVPAYGLMAMKSLVHLKSHRITLRVNDKEITDDFMIILIGNSKSIGGMTGLWGSDIGLDDGLFEVFMVRKPSSVMDWNYVIGDLLLEHRENEVVQRLKADTIEFFSSEKLKWVKDGEFAGDLNYVKVTNLNRALEIACGEPVSTGLGGKAPL